jgi:hypothetical protein
MHTLRTLAIPLSASDCAIPAMEKSLCTVIRDPDWGYSEEVNYNSHLGNTATVYGGFSRPFFRSKRWEVDYSLFMGIAYSRLKYNPDYNADDELIGSRWLLYFGAGFHATYRVADDWGIKAGS